MHAQKHTHRRLRPFNITITIRVEDETPPVTLKPCKLKYETSVLSTKQVLKHLYVTLKHLPVTLKHLYVTLKRLPVTLKHLFVTSTLTDGHGEEAEGQHLAGFIIYHHHHHGTQRQSQACRRSS